MRADLRVTSHVASHDRVRFRLSLFLTTLPPTTVFGFRVPTETPYIMATKAKADAKVPVLKGQEGNMQTQYISGHVLTLEFLLCPQRRMRF